MGKCLAIRTYDHRMNAALGPETIEVWSRLLLVTGVISVLVQSSDGPYIPHEPESRTRAPQTLKSLLDAHYSMRGCV